MTTRRRIQEDLGAHLKALQENLGAHLCDLETDGPRRADERVPLKASWVYGPYADVLLPPR